MSNDIHTGQSRNEAISRRALLKHLMKEWVDGGGTSRTPDKHQAGKMLAFVEWLIDSGRLTIPETTTTTRE